MIEVNNLTKVFKKPIRDHGLWGMVKTLFSRKYESKVAVDHIDMTINDGEIVGYIGGNGAGKSTTVKMMTGILFPTEGEVIIDGINVQKNRIKAVKNIGVLFGQKTQLMWDIQVIETFKLLKQVYDVSDEDYNERLEYLTNLLDLKPFLNQTARSLSLGQMMRAGFAASIIHNPKVLFLDEPTIGLDVIAKEKIKYAIKELNKKYNTTIILTSHDMRDIEELCDRVIIIDKGSIVYDGKLKHLKNKYGNIKTLSIPLKNEVMISKLNTFEKKVSYKLQGDYLEVSYNEDEISTKEVFNYIITLFDIADMEISSINIEDVAKDLYKKE